MVVYLFFLAVVASALQLQTLPPVHFNHSHVDSDSGFSLVTANNVIYIQEEFASWRDQGGLTLIPPSASEFARTFQKDLQELSNSSWDLQTVKQFPPHASGVFLARTTKHHFTYEDGTPTEEGYELVVENERVLIHAAGSRGMWWGTRTLLQQLVLSPHSVLSTGRVTDAPAYPTRGFMLDAGRKWYALDFLKDLCTYASFFKISEFHYHATDNYPLSRGPNVPWDEVYSQFALRPENVGLLPLVQRRNETLSRAEFDDFQDHCAQRGITVIPELEAPGHCLSITKWKPELALNKQDLLNLSHPEAIPLVKSMWSEFLPWFHTKEVHIGADEYNSTLADDYIGFVNEMSRFIYQTHGKTIRIWGTDEPSRSRSIDSNVTIQHWQYGQSDPLSLARNGYHIINSEDWWAYMSLKNKHLPITPAPYPQFFNNSRLLNFADMKQWQWTPELFNHVNITEQPDRKAVKGAIMVAWNDNGPAATTQLEAYYAIRNGIPVVASRAWSGSRGPRLHEATLDTSIRHLTDKAPGQNLDRRWSGGQIQLPNSEFQDPMGHGSKGLNYTLDLHVDGAFSLHSNDTTLSLSEHGRLSFAADGWEWPLRSVAQSDGFDPEEPGRIWANATSSTHEIVAVPQRAKITITTNALAGSRVWINGEFMGRFEVFVYGGQNLTFSWSQMAFVAPLQYSDGSGLRKVVLN